MSSEGCTLNSGSSSQRRAPFTSRPNPGISTSTRSATPPRNNAGAACWHGVARCSIAQRLLDRFLERAAVLELHAAAVERRRDARRIAADQQDPACKLRNRLGKRRKILTLAVAAQDQNRLLPQAAQRGDR